MAGDWITGEELMREYSIVPVELGSACFGRELTAYFQAGWGPIYEISKLDRVPKYPPPGVDRMDHVRRSESVRWDWEDILQVSEKRTELDQCEQLLRYAVAVCKEKYPQTLLPEISSILFLLSYLPCEEMISYFCKTNPLNDYTFEQLSEFITVLESKRTSLYGEIYRLTAPHLDARIAAECIMADLNTSKVGYGKDLHTPAETFAWQTLMPIAYYWLSDGQMQTDGDLEGRLFCFDFDMFLFRFQKGLTDVGKEKASIKLVVASYEKHLKEMWFQRTEVEAWVTAPQGSSQSLDQASIQAYKDAANKETAGRRKKLLAALYTAQGKTREEIAEDLKMSKTSISNVSTYAKEGLSIAEELSLPSLSKNESKPFR